jgi:hypothetical protein
VKKKELYLTWLTNLSIEESFTSDKHKLVSEDHFETYEFIIQSLFANLRFAPIDYGKTNESGGKGSSLMRHIYKRFFSKIKFVKKNPKRPILRSKMVLMPFFIKIALCNRSFMHYNKETHKLKVQKVTG